MSVHNTEFQYSYKGFQYRTWDDVEPDNIKTFHECYKDGTEVQLCRAFANSSPYRLVKREDFIRYVEEYILVDFARV